MRKFARKLMMAVGGGLLALGLFGCGKEEAASKASAETSSQASVETSSQAPAEAVQEKTVIRQGVMSGNIDHWVAAVGQEKGFFDKYGIQLETTEFAVGINTIDVAVTGQIDIGMLADYAAVNRLGNTQDNTELCIFARFAKTKGNSNQLYVNTDEVKELSDLAGKGFITLPGTVWDYYAGVTFNKAGIAKEDQVLVNVDNAQAALGVMQAGDGVAFWASGTNGRKLAEAGYQPIANAEEFDMPTEQFYLANRTYLNEHEEAVKNYIKAVDETEKWIAANKEEAAKIVNDKVNIPEEQFLESFDVLELEMSLKQESLDHLNAIKEWALSEGKFEKDFDFKDFIDSKILKEIVPENVEL